MKRLLAAPMRKLLPFFVFCLAGSLYAAGASAYDDWFKTFYKTDDVGRFDGFWEFTLTSKVLENKNALPPTIGFVSQVLHRHPELIAGRFDDFSKFSDAERKAILAILWSSDTEQARNVLKANGQVELAKDPTPAVSAKQVLQAGDLDFCWGSFFGSGDVTSLNPIIVALDNAKYAGALKRYKTSKQTEEDKEAAYNDAIFGAAMWSLGANAKENPLVLAQLEKSIADKETPDARRLWLGVILSKLKPEKYKVDAPKGGKARLLIMPDSPIPPTDASFMGWRDETGKRVAPTDTRNSINGFGASVIVTADPDWEKQWNTPPEVTPHFSETNLIHVGERVTLLVFFAGPMADKNGEAEVTYDLTIRRPNGRVTKQKDLKGMKGKLKGTATNTYLAEALVGLVCDPEDPLGEWEFEIAVRDVVRNVTVPLKAKITLKAPAAPVVTPVSGGEH